MKSVPVISALEILIGKEIHSLWDDQNYWGILQKYFFAGAGEEGDPAPLPGPGLAAVTGGAWLASQTAVRGVPEADLAQREADQEGHRPHLPWPRLLQGEGWTWPGELV